jgi:Kef-type K+ transport system membrane component KefB
MSSQTLAVQFFLQLAAILVACRLAGALVARLGQPKVVGEMIAGILLGPSLLGLVAPTAHAALFPPSSFPILSVVSQFGLVLYMFIVGTRLQNDFLKEAFRTAMVISMSGVVAPFILGAALGAVLQGDGRFFAVEVSPWQAMMYLGAAMSVTAFPVLARIIQERGIAGRPWGRWRSRWGHR